MSRGNEKSGSEANLDFSTTKCNSISFYTILRRVREDILKISVYLLVEPLGFGPPPHPKTIVVHIFFVYFSCDWLSDWLTNKIFGFPQHNICLNQFN